MSHLPFLTVDPDRSPAMTADSSDTGATSSAAAVEKSAVQLRQTPANTSRIPGFIGFPFAVVVALGASAGLYSVAAELTGYELSTISRTLTEPWQIGALVGWRILNLYFSWASGFDYWDTASLALLSITPYHALIALFYNVSPQAILLSLSIDVLSSALPFATLRPLAPYNDPPAFSPASTSLATTGSLKLYITTFLTVLYAVSIYTSLQTFLPSYIVSTFDIPTLERAHAASLPILLTILLPLGNAAKDFLYVPSTYLSRIAIETAEFDPQTATLSETLAWNVGLSGWGKREDVLVKRTLGLVALTLGESVGKIYATVEGAELAGALGWGGVFAAASLIAGVGLGYVGDA